MDVDVQIDGLSLSWASGMEISGLKIGSTGDTGPEPMAEIDRVRMDFSPIDLFIHDRVEWMELDRPRFSVRYGPDGSLNVERLTRLDFEARAERITQRKGVVTFSMPGRSDPLQLEVTDLQVFPGKTYGIGRVTMAAWLVQKPSPVPVSLHLTDRPAASGLAAQASFSFRGIDLAQLGLKEALELPLESLSGSCDGAIELQMSRQGEVNQFNAKLDIHQLDIQPAKETELPPIRSEKAGFDISATVDLFRKGDTPSMELKSNYFNLPGIDLDHLHLAVARPVGGAPVIELLDLKGKVEPGNLLALLKGYKPPADGLTCARPVSIDRLFIKREGHSVAFELAADATEAQLSRGGKCVKPSNTKLRFDLAGVLDDRTRAFHIRKGSLQLGENWISHGEGQLADVRPVVDSLLYETDQPAGKALEHLSVVASCGSFNLEELGSLADLAPSLAPMLNYVELRGALTGQWKFPVETPYGAPTLQAGAPRQELEVSADLTEAKLKFDRLFVKPAGQAAQMQLRYTRDEPSAPEARGRLDLLVGLFPPSYSDRPQAASAPVKLTACLPISKAPGEAPFGGYEAALKLQVADASWLAQCCPALNDQLDATALQGMAVSGSTRIKIREDRSLIMEADQEHPISLQTGGSRLALAGEASFRPANLPGPRGAENADLEFDRFQVHVDGKLSVDENLCRLVPQLKTLAARHGVRGTATFAADVQGDGDTIRITGAEIDAEGLAADRIGWATKPAGLPAAARFTATVAPDLSQATVDELTGRIGDVSLQASGSARLEHIGGEVSLRDWQLRLTASTKNAGSLQDLVPAWKELALAGDASVDMELAGGGDVVARRVDFFAEHFGARYRGTQLGLHGELTFEDVRPREGELPSIGRLKTDAIEVLIGANRAWVVGDITNPLNGPAGAVHVLAEYMDDKALLDSLNALAADEQSTTRPAGAAAQGPNPLDRAARIVGDMQGWLGNANLTARVSLKRLKTYDESAREYYDVRCLEMDASAVNGMCRLSYAGGINGGRTSGEYLIDLTKPAPKVEARTEFKDVIATESIQPQIAKYFPGNQVAGYFSRSEEIAFPLIDTVGSLMGGGTQVRTTGKAVTVTTDGTITGRAAPKFVSEIFFPGLNLATYRYKTMTGFAELKEDGSADNDMIFDGRYSDLYITGTTDAKNIGRYQIGVILLSAPQSPEWNHTYRLGRIPILNFEARIEGGKMHDVRISYLRPDEIIAAILLTNNPLYRLLSGG